MRLTILCEGDTQQAVLKKFLAPFCQGFDRVFIFNSRGAGRLKQEYKKITELELSSDPEAVVFCLIDLFRAPFTVPRYVKEEADPHLAQYTYIKKHMEENINTTLRERFYAFPIVMEIETWLLADEQALNDYLTPPRTRRFQRPHNPETIAHPAEELGGLVRLHRSEDYIKTIHGRRLFERASVERVYNDNCPHFEIMINQLLVLQGHEPDKPTPEFRVPDQELFEQFSELFRKHDELIDRSLMGNESAEVDWEYTEMELQALEARMNELNRQIADSYSEDA
jgi:hypothetical protein